MAQRKKTTTITEIIPAETETPTETTGIGVSDYNVVLTKVHRILANGKRAFAFQTETEVDEVVIQDRYPQGGSFGVERFNELGQSIERVVIDIDAKPMIGNPTTGTPANGNDLVTQMLLNELSWMRQTMTNMIMKNNDSGEKSTIGEMVTALQGLNGLVGGKDPMDLFIKGMDMASKFKNGGEVDWKTQLLDVVKETAGPAIQAFTMAQRNVNTNGNGNGEQPMRIVKTPEQELKEGIDWLKKKILGGLTSELAVDWIVQNANDPSYQPIIATAINGGVDAFIALDAEIGNEPFKTWFTNAIEELKGIYAEQSANATDMDGGNGNGADVADNAKPRVAKSQKPKGV